MAPGGRFRALQSWLRAHPFWAAGFAFAIGFAAVNLLAYRHAYAMLHFAEGGTRTAKPQALTAGQKVPTLLTGVRVPRPVNTRTPADIGLPFETRTIRVDGDVRLEAWSVPAENPRGTVLLFHGYGGAKSGLLGEAKVFHDLGHDVLLADFRGGGGSTGRDTTIGYAEAEDVAACVEFVRSRHPGRPVILYGQSMGAAAILRAVHAGGVRPDGLILESVFDRLLTTVKSRFELMGVPPSPGSELLVFWGGVRSGYWGFGHNPAEYAASCRCPALMLHGGADANAKISGAEAVRRNLPDGTRLEIFPNTGHASLLGADPRRWHRAIVRFLDEVAPSR